ncbi:MAG: carbohydrate-binding family 9-like protein [Saccharofermentanales bacterium]|jgi:hypothetical protein
MQEYRIARKQIPFIWEDIRLLHINKPAWGMCADGIEAAAQLCYDKHTLYIKLSAQEAHIRAEVREPLEQPCQDSCLEFFFSPVEGDNRYFNIEINPNGLIFWGIGRNRHDLIRLYPTTPMLSPHVERFEKGWSVDYAISKELITMFFPSFSFKPNQSMRANFYKCGDKCVRPHYYSWNPMTCSTPDFHRPQDFGRLIFE